MPANSVFDYRGTYDENWPLPAHLTLEQYRRVFFRPDAHFVDGRIIPRTLGDRVHSDAVSALIGALQPVCGALACRSCISLRLQVSPTHIRVCDLVVLDPKAPREQVPTHPPLLCVEVLAPTQTAADELDTLTDYLKMGVENIWLIDPLHRAAWTFDVTGLHEADPTRLNLRDTPIDVDLREASEALI